MESDDNMQNTFVDIFEKKRWGKSWESASGPGSSEEATRIIRDKLLILFEMRNVKSILDVPCGDFNWMSKIRAAYKPTGDIAYSGWDIVPEIVANNVKEHGTIDGFSFVTGDIRKDEMPTVDLILVRDCFIHLSHEDIFLSLKNIKWSQSKYLLVTHVGKRTLNRDKSTDHKFRPLNFSRPPFNFPAPELVINEDDDPSGKSLALWKVEDINVNRSKG